jgi:hypothetical protein
MASYATVSNGGGVANIAAGKSLVDIAPGPWYIRLYGPPNKAIGEILLNGRVGSIVHDYTQRVAQTYSTMIETRSRSGALAASITATVNPYWGYKRDRWVGEVRVGSSSTPYGAADEYGRNQYSPYEGSGNLVDALYMHLSERI